LILTSSSISPISCKNKINKIITPSTNKDTKMNNINFSPSTKSIINLGSTELNEQNDNNLIINKKSSKNTNKNQFIKIKKLIAEFEKEKNEKERLHRFKSKKNDKSKKNQNFKTKKNFRPLHVPPKNLSLLPNKKIYYNIPKMKSQMQFNRYLINDFKENDSELDYIKRSLKYQKINEDFDELIYLKQIKEVAKNGIAENVIDEAKKAEPEFFDSPDSEKGSNNSLKKVMSKNISEFNMENIIRNKKFYNSNLKRFYTEKIKEIPQNLLKSPNKRISLNNINNANTNTNSNANINKSNNNINNQLNLFNNFITKTNWNEAEKEKEKEKENEKEKEKEKENSIIEETKNMNNNKSPGIKFLMETRNKKNGTIRTKKKKITMSIDKYNFSNRIYESQKKDYNKYMRKKQYMRGKNFSKQIALINKEKEKLGLIETENNEPNTERGLPKLLIPNLLFQIEYKDIFKNSFNTLRVFEEGDQDLDLDDLNKIRNSIKEYEIEMFKVLKKNNGLNYIKKHFNKTTVGKFQSTKGIYFGD